jgi:hypothetical protein
MKVAIAGVCANFLGVLLIYSNLVEDRRFDDATTNVIISIIVGFWALSVLGLILVGIGKRKAGGILTIIGAIPFVPLGLIAVFGARSAMMAGNEKGNSGQDLDERRRLACAVSNPPAAISEKENP